MLRNDTNRGNLVNISNIESLHLTVILDIPNIYHAFCITGYEAFQPGWAIYTNKRGFVTLQANDFLFPVWIPDKYMEVEANTD